MISKCFLTKILKIHNFGDIGTKNFRFFSLSMLYFDILIKWHGKLVFELGKHMSESQLGYLLIMWWWVSYLPSSSPSVFTCEKKVVPTLISKGDGGEKDGGVEGCGAHVPPRTDQKYTYMWSNSRWKLTWDWQGNSCK